MWDEAIERAKYLDNLPASAPRGVFHGLPISLKEHLGMTGKTVNGGWVKRIGDASSATPINDILWNAGCVFYVRTTQPQLLMHLECHTNIHGRTVNPWNRNLTCGGSSGGEGALVGMGGSVLVSSGMDTMFIYRCTTKSSRVLEAILEAAFAPQPPTMAFMASSPQRVASR